MSSNGKTSAEFAHWNSYQRYARKVRRSRRFVMGQEEQSFLQTVLATVPKRNHELKAGRTFYRAQLGVELQELTDSDGDYLDTDVVGYGATRMKPLPDRAREGRVNAAGIPALYVANTVETAVSEVRPWVDVEISVATCKLVRPLRTLDLSDGHGKSSFSSAVFKTAVGGKGMIAKEKATAVWIDIDNAFSKPVTASDDQADYAPTQILAELFQSAGYEALVYKSHFGDTEKMGGYNIAIFDLEAVEIVSCAPYRVQSINIKAEQTGNAWYKPKP